MKLLSVWLLMMLSFGCGGYGSGSGMRPATTPNISALSPDGGNAGGGDFVLRSMERASPAIQWSIGTQPAFPQLT